MKLGIFSMYDSAVKAFMQPFFSPTKGAAIRSFTDAVRREENLKAHAGDYSLFFLGEWDDASGAFVSVSAPERILLASEVELS